MIAVVVVMIVVEVVVDPVVNVDAVDVVAAVDAADFVDSIAAEYDASEIMQKKEEINKNMIALHDTCKR